MLKLTVRSYATSEWDKEGLQGEEVASGHIGDSYGLETLTTENICKTLRTYGDLKPADLFIYDNDIQFSIIENKDGLADENGNYIVDYWATVEKIVPVDLSQLTGVNR